MAFSLVALIAVFLQAFVVQTHIHAPIAPAAPAFELSASGHAETHVSDRGADQIACVFCQALAAGGTALAPDATAAFSLDHANVVAIVALALAPRVHTHSWQSRAPPTFP